MSSHAAISQEKVVRKKAIDAKIVSISLSAKPSQAFNPGLKIIGNLADKLIRLIFEIFCQNPESESMGHFF